METDYPVLDFCYNTSRRARSVEKKSYSVSARQVPPEVWERLNYSWMIFFAAIGGINLYVAYHFSTNIWVNFKLFGILGLMLLFVILQGFMLSPYIREDGE